MNPGLLGIIFLVVFVAQAVVFSIIIFILKKILDNQLRESALHQIETLRSDALDTQITEVAVISFREFDEASQKRVRDALAKKIQKDITIKIRNEKAMMGGVIIQFKGHLIDCSLLSRLKEGGFLK